MLAIELHDLDDVELVAKLEAAFGIKIAGSESLACHTVGDLFDLVASKVPHVEFGAVPCLAASGFRRLRAALREIGTPMRIAPDTPFSALMPVKGRRAWRRELARLTDLPSVPLPRHHPLFDVAAGCLAAALALAAGVGGWSFLLGGIAATVAFAVASLSSAGTAAIGTDATVGDLARYAAIMRPGRLADGGLMRRHEVWAAVEGVIRQMTGFSGPIDRRTRFKVT